MKKVNGEDKARRDPIGKRYCLIGRQNVQNRQSGGTRNLSSPRRVRPTFLFLNYESLQIMSLGRAFLFLLLFIFLVALFPFLISSSSYLVRRIYTKGDRQRHAAT